VKVRRRKCNRCGHYGPVTEMVHTGYGRVMYSEAHFAHKTCMETERMNRALDEIVRIVNEHEQAGHALNNLDEIRTIAQRALAPQDKHCQSCLFMRQRRLTDLPKEAGYDLARHWCAKNGHPTLPEALRCGGDDYRPARRTPRKMIPREELIEGRWYVGRGRNANVALWTRMGKTDRFTFLTISFKFNQPDVKDEGYYEKDHGCFQPFALIDEGLALQTIGGEPGWEQHYAKLLEV
jgi:hypothetical protein